MTDETRITLRLPTDVYRTIQQFAAADGRSINGEITWLLRRQMDARQEEVKAMASNMTTIGTVEIRNRHADVLAHGDLRTDETWEEAATRIYNAALRPRLGGPRRRIALSQSFPGGGTKHVQFGYRIGGADGPTTLDEMVVIHVARG